MQPTMVLCILSLKGSVKPQNNLLSFGISFCAVVDVDVIMITNRACLLRLLEAGKYGYY
jgi:hypothetical protein